MLSLSQIAGQEGAVKILQSALPPGEPASGYLFTGPEGVGKRTTALAFARALLCAENGKDACGHCASCKKAESGNHPDIIMLEPEIRDKKVKEEISIEHVRKLIYRLGFKPYESSRQVVIVEGAEMMNLPAANAFLKTLEEPPGRTVIILLAVNAFRLLPTILSRLQKARFNPLPFETAVELFMRKPGVTVEEAGRLAALTRGAPGMAEEESISALNRHRAYALSLVSSATSQGSTADGFKVAFELDKAADKATFDRTLESLLEIIKDLAAIKTTGGYDKVVNMDIVEELSRLAARLPLRKLFTAYEATLDISRARRLNVNPLLAAGLIHHEIKLR
ncbi:MAG: DNA polymerase III subunit delta' [Nitrospinae bacterium]|nr:DNA polymerase III subunit delta' [Nitrospinota bacterium]